LEDYARESGIQPVFETEVLSIRKDGSHWVSETNKEVYQSDFVIVASGLNNKPIIPGIKGSAHLTETCFTAQAIKMVCPSGVSAYSLLAW